MERTSSVDEFMAMMMARMVDLCPVLQYRSEMPVIDEDAIEAARIMSVFWGKSPTRIKVPGMF